MCQDTDAVAKDIGLVPTIRAGFYVFEVEGLHVVSRQQHGSPGFGRSKQIPQFAARQSILRVLSRMSHHKSSSAVLTVPLQVVLTIPAVG